MSGFYIFLSLIILISFLLVVVIMVQNPKGGGLSASAFGGGGNQIVGGVKKTSDFLDRSTWTLAALLFLFVLLSNYTLRDGFSTSESRLLQETETTDDFPADTELPAEGGIIEEQLPASESPQGSETEGGNE